MFISYRWSSPAHEEWVLALASNLRANGVEALIDKWDLREGHDSNAFMERMVSDASVTKVLLVCDEGYVERADARAGGVGVETQIVSPQVYAKADQSKFAAAILVFDDTGKPLLPIYMQGRLGFDFSTEATYPSSFERLVRWAYGKPFHVPPPVAQAPAFLSETHKAAAIVGPALLGLHTSQRLGGANSADAAAEVLASIRQVLPSLRLELVGKQDGDQDVVDGIQGNIALREQALEAIESLVTANTQRARDETHRLFNDVIAGSENQKFNVAYSKMDGDVVRFFGNSVFLGFVAICLRRSAFQFMSDVLTMPFFKPSTGSFTGKGVDYSELNGFIDTFEIRKRRLNLNRTSLYADYIEEVSRTSRVTHGEMIEAEFLLFLRSLLTTVGINLPRWHPQNLVFATDLYGSLPTFVKASSKSFYERMKPILGGAEAIQVRQAIEPYKSGAKHLRFDYWDVNVPLLANSDNLASM